MDPTVISLINKFGKDKETQLILLLPTKVEDKQLIEPSLIENELERIGVYYSKSARLYAITDDVSLFQLSLFTNSRIVSSVYEKRVKRVPLKKRIRTMFRHHKRLFSIKELTTFLNCSEENLKLILKEEVKNGLILDVDGYFQASPSLKVKKRIRFSKNEKFIISILEETYIGWVSVSNLLSLQQSFSVDFLTKGNVRWAIKRLFNKKRVAIGIVDEKFRKLSKNFNYRRIHLTDEFFSHGTYNLKCIIPNFKIERVEIIPIGSNKFCIIDNLTKVIYGINENGKIRFPMNDEYMKSIEICRKKSILHGSEYFQIVADEEII